jgi:hypothetical protein
MMMNMLVNFIDVAILGVFFGILAGMSLLFAIVTACICWPEGVKSRGAYIASWFASAPTVLSLAAVTLFWLRVRFASLDAITPSHRNVANNQLAGSLSSTIGQLARLMYW